MANSQKGEFEAVLAGRTYTFKMGTRALVEMQELLSPPGKVIPVEDIIRDVLKQRLKYVQAFVWAGLRKYHPEVSMVELEDMLDDSDEQEVQALLQKMGLTTVPDQQDLDELGVSSKANPSKARATAKKPRGTGANSTSTPAVSA